jgi:hypothetical protein
VVNAQGGDEVRRAVLGDAKEAELRNIFVAALRLIINEWSWSAITTSPCAIPRSLSVLRDKIRVFALPERRSDRVQPRREAQDEQLRPQAPEHPSSGNRAI